ncbi:MAG TPA: FtsX-like permease family protein, partial [Micromonosporaceae bacterium]
QLKALSAKLRPSVGPPLTVTGTMSVTIDASNVRPNSISLGALIIPPGEQAFEDTFGDLSSGRRTYHALLSGCESGCRFAGLTLGEDPQATGKVNAHIEIESIVAGKVAIHDFSDSKLWSAQSTDGQPIGSALSLSPGRAMEASLSADSSVTGLISYQDSPTSLPVVVSAGAKSSDKSASSFTFPEFGGTPVPMSAVKTTDVIPRAGRNAILFDLNTGLATGDRIDALNDPTQVQYEVWTNDKAPANMAKLLSAQGVSVLQTQSIPQYLSALSRSAPTLSLWFYLFAGVLALVLAIGVVLLGAYVGATARIYEYAALQVAGVRPRQLRRAVLREYWVMLGITLVVGVAAGAAGAVLMLPSIPLVTAGQAIGSVPYSTRLFALYGALVVALAAMAVVVWMAMRVLRRGTPERLREGIR